MRVVGFLTAGETDANAGFSTQEHIGNFRKDFWLDVRGDGLRYLPQGSFGDLHANWRAIVFDSEPEFASSMLVEYGRQGIQALAKLGEAFLEFNGFGFVQFRTGGVEQVWGLSHLFWKRGAI
jgi:hypothetical protein